MTSSFNSACIIKTACLLFGIILPHALLGQTNTSSTVPIEFNVNMSYMIEQDMFDPETEFVDVAGTFNGWGEDLTKLSDPDQDSIYTVTVEGFSPGTTIEYKFRLNGQWGGREEFPGEGNNRVYTVQEDSNVIEVWYNDQLPETGPPQAHFEIRNPDIPEGDLVQFQNFSQGAITTWEWKFEGGSPATSDQKNPSVQYFAAGSYDVTLVARDTVDNEADTLLKPDAITVREKTDDGQQTYWWNKRVFYEIFVRSFYDSDGDGIGDFDGLRQKLDYLNDGDPSTDHDLGITGIWLMPIHPSPTYHGYDATDYRAINPDYGTKQDFKEFLDAAHKRGIKVIIDFVMNHTSSQHPWFEKSAAGDSTYRNFYRWKARHPGYQGPWGQNVWHERNGSYYYGVFWGGMPDLNYKNPAVKDSMFARASYWLEEVGVDGFRLDAVLYMIEDGENQENTDETYQFWGEFNTHMEQVAPDAFSVAEAWQPTDIAQNYVTADRLDYGFEFDLSSAIRTVVQEGDAAPLRAQMQEVTSTYRYQQYGTFLTNHDQTRIFNELNGNIDRYKAAASLYLTLPGVPYIYYGEEIGMKGAKPDPDIRRPMQWSAENYAGFSTTTPWDSLNTNYQSYNVAVERADTSSLWHHYDRLIELRNRYPALRTGHYLGVPVNSDSVFAFVREGADSTMLVISHLGTTTQSDIQLHIASKYLSSEGGVKFNNLLNSGDTVRAAIESGSPSDQVRRITMAPYQTMILNLSDPIYTAIKSTPGDHPQRIKLYENYPNPFNPTTTIRYQLPRPTHVRLFVTDILGRKVATLVDERRQNGTHTVHFDGSGLASGVYLYRLETQHYSRTRKMMLVK